MTAPHWWNYALEAAYFTTYSSVALAIAQKKLVRTWPWLFTFCIVTVAMTMATVALQGRRSTYSTYFYMHWTGEALRALLMLAVLYETVHTVPLVKHIPSALRAFFATLIGALTLAAAIYVSRQAPATPYAITNAAIALEKSASVAWCVFTLGIFAAVALVGLAWTMLPLRIARGAIWQTLVAIAISHAIAMRPSERVALTILSDCLHLCAVPYWYWAFRQPDSVTNEDLAALHDLLPHLRYKPISHRKGNAS